jgi:hypothetical protein
MAYGHGTEENSFYSLIPLEEFKALLGVDDREDCLYFASVQNTGALFRPPSLAAFCLVTATFTMEQYCMRRLIRKKHFERFEYTGDLVLPLREYPVDEVLAVYGLAGSGSGEVLEPEYYHTVPDCGTDVDLPFALCLSPALKRLRGVKAVYWAGYAPGEVPADLASACLELAAWNMSRYRGKRIGMTGAIRGSGRDGEHLESSMPENVRLLLEPYKRRTI